MGGFSHLAGVLHNTIYGAEGETVTYTLNTALSGGLTTATFDAIQAESRRQVTNELGLLTRIKTKDFLIKVSEVELVGITQPRRDDKITTEDGQVWQVMSPATGLDVFEYSDHKQTLYRIHTKKAKQ
jgi:hypothetical protein